jgi:hypothetical protein
VKHAEQDETRSSTVALAWLRSQPGLQSMIIGARTLEQLDGNTSRPARTPCWTASGIGHSWKPSMQRTRRRSDFYGAFGLWRPSSQMKSERRSVFSRLMSTKVSDMVIRGDRTRLCNPRRRSFTFRV